MVEDPVQGTDFPRVPAKKEETVFSASMDGNIAALQKLLLSGEKLNVVDHCEQTLLHTAAKSGRVAMVDFLLRRNNTGWT
jgi:ankyrin repeat protein